jgi:hypothetical protein
MGKSVRGKFSVDLRSSGTRAFLREFPTALCHRNGLLNTRNIFHYTGQGCFGCAGGLRSLQDLQVTPSETGGTKVQQLSVPGFHRRQRNFRFGRGYEQQVSSVSPRGVKARFIALFVRSPENVVGLKKLRLSVYRSI